jgi:hypothetical protein
MALQITKYRHSDCGGAHRLAVILFGSTACVPQDSGALPCFAAGGADDDLTRWNGREER